MTRILEKYAQYLVLAPLPDESLTQAQGPSMQSVKLPGQSRQQPGDARPPLPPELRYVGEQTESGKRFEQLRKNYFCRWWRNRATGEWCVTE